jgi:hypothetical protein
MGSGPYLHTPVQAGGESLGRSHRWMQTGGETAAPERPHEAQRRAPRCGAWLRSCMVSSNEVGFNPRVKYCPIPNTPTQLPNRQGMARSVVARSKGATTTQAGGRSASKRFRRVNLNYPADISGAAESGMGWLDNHHLNSPVESTVMNVRGPWIRRPAVGR